MNETLSDLEPLRTRFEQVGAPSQLLEVWFASTLRDGFALTAAGAYAGFRPVAAAVLRGQLAQIEALRGTPEDAAEYVLEGFAELDVHPDVGAGMRRLAQAGVRMVTLSNGAAEIAARLLERAGLAHLVERCLSVDEVRRWKPAPEPYLHAASECGVPPDRCALIAVHPWDVDGAKRAGLQAGWLSGTVRLTVGRPRLRRGRGCGPVAAGAGTSAICSTSAARLTLPSNDASGARA